jgi:hypothetical protein
VNFLEPAHLARRWAVNLKWLREELLSALGGLVTGAKGTHLDEDPVFLGEVNIDEQKVAVYFAARMASERHYRHVDTALRLRPRSVPGIVLTTAAQPFPFAGTNVVIPIEDMLGAGEDRPSIDHEALAVAYRNGQLAARGGTSIAVQVSLDRQSGMLTIPGQAPWLITGRMKIVVLERLAQAHTSGPGHLVTKALLQDTGCDSLDGLFGADSRWRQYIERVPGTRAWRLRMKTEHEAPTTSVAQVDDPEQVAPNW